MVEASAVSYHIPYTYKKLFSPEECTEIIKFFKLADASGDGHIQASEFGQILKHMGRDEIKPEAVEKLLAKYDRNNDSQLDFGEFLEMFSNFKIKDKIAENADHSKGAASTTGFVG